MTDDLPLFAVTHSRLHGEPTSYEAAKSMSRHAQIQVLRLYAALLDHGPMTCDEIDRMNEWRPTTAGRRVADAERAGLVEFTGETRPTRSGRKANVYRAVANERKGAA